MWCLHLPIDLPSANNRLVNGRDPVSRARYKRARDGYAAAVRGEAQRLGIPIVASRAVWSTVDPLSLVYTLDALPFRVVRIVRLMGKRQRPFEDDDFIGGAKGFRDACQRDRIQNGKLVAGAGLVWDDSPRHSEWTYAQERAPDERPGVRLEIADQLSIPEAA